MHDHNGGGALRGRCHPTERSERRRRRFGVLMWAIIIIGVAAAVGALSGLLPLLPAASVVLTLVIVGCLLVCVFAAWAGGREARSVERTAAQLATRRADRHEPESRRQT
jgi:membrane protein implicated in regulation of membrane protease activity